MKTTPLWGSLGSRLREETEFKPLVDGEIQSCSAVFTEFL